MQSKLENNKFVEYPRKEHRFQSDLIQKVLSMINIIEYATVWIIRIKIMTQIKHQM